MIWHFFLFPFVFVYLKVLNNFCKLYFLFKNCNIGAVVFFVQYALRKLYHESPRLICVLYTAPTCGPCRTLKPILSKVFKLTTVVPHYTHSASFACYNDVNLSYTMWLHSLGMHVSDSVVFIFVSLLVVCITFISGGVMDHLDTEE